MTRFGGYLSNPNFARAWEASDQALEVALKYAEAAKPIAESLAAEDSGDYRDAFEADAGVVEGKATGRLRNTDFKAHWLEFGTSRKDSGGRAQPALRPAMEAATGSPVKGDRR